MVIEKNTIGEAWLNAVKEVLSGGSKIKYRNTELLEIINLQIIINNPSEQDSIIDKHGDKKMLEYMEKNFQGDEDNQRGYTYKQRIFNFREINQLNYSLKNLQKRENSMDAIFSTLMPEKDDKHVPCLTLLQYLVRDNILIVFSHFKSIDIGKKAYGDFLEITKLFSKIKNQLKLENVKIIANIASAHIYKEDIGNLKNLLKEIKKR
jgi:thymidylate synthase